MLRALQDQVLRISRTGWLYLVVTALAIASLLVLQQIAAAFRPLAGGMDPLDLQHTLAASEIYPQFAGYEPGARDLYLRFALIDLGFPLFSGLFLAATIAYALRSSAPGVYQRLADRRLLLLPLLGTVFDWAENLAVLTALVRYPVESGALPALIVAAKRAKLACVTGFNLLMLGLLAYAAVRYTAARFRRAEPGPDQ